MVTKECDEVKQNRIEPILAILKKQLQKDCERIVSCLYKCFKQEFIKWATITYNNYPPEFISFASNSSFTDGILTFSEKAVEGGIYSGSASLKTILFGFYKIKLLENLQKEKRLLEKKEKHTFSHNPEILDITNDGAADNEKRYLIVEQALSKMEPADRQIIIWRHLEEKPCDEIAALLGINKESATNRIYRCMQRLRNLTENSNK